MRLGGGTHLEYHALVVLDEVEGEGICVHQCVAAVAEHIDSLMQELSLQGSCDMHVTHHSAVQLQLNTSLHLGLQGAGWSFTTRHHSARAARES